MFKIQNRIWKSIVSIMLITALILSGLFSYPNTSYGLTQYITITHYRLDTGVTFLWKNSAGKWIYNNWEPGGGYSFTYNHTIDKDAENVSVTAYQEDADYGEAGYFPFEDHKKIDSSCIHWNATTLSKTKKAYDTNYNRYAVTPSEISINKISPGNLKLNYDVTFNTICGDKYDVKEKLSWGETGKVEVLTLLGDPTDSEIEAMDLMNPDSENYSSNVEGYLYFIPVVIKYDVVEEVYIAENDFTPYLDVPSSAKAGDSFTVTDKTIFDKEAQFAESTLSYTVDGGSKVIVDDWDGSTLGSKIDQSFDEVCTVTYTLMVGNIYGTDKSVSETIKITDNREIKVVADLVLPAYTYEGHTVLAQDQSTFEVDGVNYSATRAYAESIADNSFKCASSYSNIVRKTDTKADATFSKFGTYNVVLTVDPISGSNVTDTESIEVRKTPYIEDTLSGFQKQNRKQILIAKVATYPGKPITDYSINIKDKKTGDSITLTPDNLQENNVTIKTREVTKTVEDDGCYTYLTVEFLTKTPSCNSAIPDYSQDFYYEINVTDSKGDSDSASKTFAVTPDIPPTAAISLDTAFLRNEGTNIASIKAEDVTVATDGDSVSRIWYYANGTTPLSYTNIPTMDGYQKLSFGTDKIVGFNKVGVGKFTTKLKVKEVWTEPTLEEYVTDAEHLTGSAIAYSDVQNVAPIVSLELLNSTEQEILLLANNNTEFQTLMNNKTALQQALLANCIDGQIILKKLVGNTPSTVIGVAQQRSLTYQYGPTVRHGSTLATEGDEGNLLAVDSENTYFLTYTWSGGYPTVPKTIHAINTYNGEVWSYTTSRNESFTYGQDDTGKYLYLIYGGSNQTVLLDKRTGTISGTINIALSSQIWLSDSLAFVVESPSIYTSAKNLYAIDMNSLTKILVAEDVSAVSRVNGDLQYITKTDSAVVKCTLDMETLSAEKDILIETGNNESTPNDYLPICIDSTGKIILWKSYGVGTDAFCGIKTYSADNKLLKEIPISLGTGNGVSPYYSFDEQGRCNHVLIWGRYTASRPDRHNLYGINLNTGAVAFHGKSTDSYNNSAGSFGGAFESNGTSYFLFNGWYMYPGAVDYYGNNYTFTFTGTSCGMSVLGPGTIGSVDENIKVSDRTVAAFNGDNDPTDGTFFLKILAFPRTLAQETSEIVSRYTDQLSFVGDINTKADEIIQKAEAAKPTMKITAAQNGYISLYNQSLKQNKQYYYEYEIKPLTDSTKSKLAGLSASTSTTTSNQSFLSDTYYVENTYYEDFQDDKTNKFYTLSDPGLWPGHGIFGSNNWDDDTEVGSASLTFTVPAGKKSILSLDYTVVTNAPDYLAGVYIDGERAYVDYPPDESDTWHHYTHYKVLSEGTHTLSCQSAYWYVWIDNLKVEILSTTKPSLKTTLNTQEGDQEDWLDVEGSFETPNGNISFGSQASTYTTGLIPYVVTKTYKNGNPRKTTYTQTVPAGYIQKGFCYPTATTYKSKTSSSYSIAGSSYKGMYRSNLPGDRVFLRTRAEGSYTHTSDADYDAYYSFIPTWELITYPSNAVTITDNISFDDSFTRYFFPKESSSGKTNLSIYFPKGEYLIKNLRIYYIENGQKVYMQNKDLDEVSDLSNWTLSTGMTASIVTEKEEEVDDEYVKIYKKGEKVLYNIFYDDYENDPSKIGYWEYSHINWPPDTVHPDVGKILTAPIDRFYLSGKYTVTHWEVDNTQRVGTVGDASSYNKESNKVAMTFYVNGEGKAPWVTYIKTNPSAVKENNSYTLSVGVDDTEKDALTLETEVYLNGKSIFTNKKTGIAADKYGDYPAQSINGLPTAKVGVYQVFCTVSDYSGVGIKSYKFTVVSEGKITGYVTHTDQWDNNRKKYNLKRFSEEVNSPILLNDYLAMKTPRKRGINVFWSGEKFMLLSETEGSPSKVTVQILSIDSQGNHKSTGYSTELTDTGKKAATGAELWEGSLWDKGMINKWGRKAPETLIFDFTAYYSEGLTKKHAVTIIVDSDHDYWQLHRLW